MRQLYRDSSETVFSSTSTTKEHFMTQFAEMLSSDLTYYRQNHKTDLQRRVTKIDGTISHPSKKWNLVN